MSDCGCDAINSQLTPFAEALETILKQAKRISGNESLKLENSSGRILAAALQSPVDVPPANNSAMDGYAVRCAEIKDGDARLPVSQRIPAGVMGQPLQPGSVARIFTGAPVPKGADAVVMQEHTTAHDDGSVTFHQAVPVGTNIRCAGEDITKGAAILEPGMCLRPQDLGLAASVGIGELSVTRRLKVATFFTGDELVNPGNKLAPGQIYNSNQFAINSLLQKLGCEVINLGIVEDTLQATRSTLKNAARQADLVITSGGVSVGDEDHVRLALEELGELCMWRISIKPGKPLAFGHIGETPFLGLPGNPVSAFVTFLLFVRPFILTQLGVKDVHPQPIVAAAAFNWPKQVKRREYVRARLQTGTDGQPEIHIYDHQGSGVLSSTSWAHGLAVLEEGSTVAMGDNLAYIPYSELL
ncbi:MAG: gephyrin-like molybdotransferase Glp [Pseudomonadota bacterium]|nr:gephyrin-like molybdotransferase Glp [Pseudomonadota bacterium]